MDLKSIDLSLLGLAGTLADQVATAGGTQFVVGRVAEQHRQQYVVWTELGTVQAEVSGRFQYLVSDASEYPVVGDFVFLRPFDAKDREHSTAIIERRFDRRTELARKAAGGDVKQVVAANVDLVLIATAVGHDFNPRRLERYLAVANGSGAKPVFVLTKSDLTADLQEYTDVLAKIGGGAAVVAVSATTGQGTKEILAHLGPGITGAIVGSSGVGKSTLINALAEADIKTATVSAHLDKGRHTTTARSLHQLRSGGLLIDTPGMRELGIAVDEESVDETFDDVTRLARQCRFSDCAHETEPGCAIKDAVASGDLDPARLRAFAKLKQE